MNTNELPKRFPVKPEFGFKGGSIPWETADRLMRIWQMEYGSNTTEHYGSLIRKAREGGLPASKLDSLVSRLKQESYFASGRSISIEWRKDFIAGDSAYWTEQAIAIFGNSTQDF